MEHRSRVSDRILNHLKKKGISDYWSTYGSAVCLFKSFNDVLLSLIMQGVVEYDAKRLEFSLTQYGHSVVRSMSGKDWQDIACSHCQGRAVEPNTFFSSGEIYQEILNQRPDRIDEYDQVNATAAVTDSRMSMMHMHADLEGKSILVLGDSALGVCLALTKMPSLVTVLDIDPRIINFNRELKEHHNLTNLDCEVYDVFSELPAKYTGVYDCFFIDSPPTEQMWKLFVTRAATCLTQDASAGYVTLSQMEASISKWKRFQEYLLQIGFVITDVIRNFNTYELQEEWLLNSHWRIVNQSPFALSIPSTPWFYSAIVRVESTGKLDLPYISPSVWSLTHYIDDEILG